MKTQQVQPNRAGMAWMTVLFRLFLPHSIVHRPSSHATSRSVAVGASRDVPYSPSPGSGLLRSEPEREVYKDRLVSF